MNNVKRIFYLLEKAASSKKTLADTLVEKGEEASEKEPLNDLHEKAGNYIPKSYIFVDENGNEIAGALVSQETVFDATVNDVREGKVFATETGVKTGEKFIPSYIVHEGYAVVMPNTAFVIKSLGEYYDFTKLQALFCPYNGSIPNSVAVEKVVINESVYSVNSTDILATVEKDSENQHINFAVTNTSNIPYLLRYFTYKEIY